MSVQDTSRGITISVTAETNAGGRRHMEDYIAVNLAPSEASFNDIGYLREQAYIGVFDGHGGKEAAKWARERLWEVIQKQPKFKSSDLKCVQESVSEGFMALHKEMEPLRGTLNFILLSVVLFVVKHGTTCVTRDYFSFMAITHYIPLASLWRCNTPKQAE